MSLSPGPAFPGSLSQGGYLGPCEVDYRDQRARVGGRVSNVFGLLRKEGPQGIELSALDGAMHPEDYERLRTARAGCVGKGGRRVFRARVLNRFNQGGLYTWIEAHYTVEVDAFGIPTGARGFILDISPFAQPEAPAIALDDLATIAVDLRCAARTAEQHGMHSLAADIDAVRAKAERIRLNRLFE